MLIRLIVIVTLASLVIQQRPPTFKSRVNLVEVDATVTDRSGTPVTDLQKNDFVLYEDGKPQPISTFSQVQLSLQTPVASTAATRRSRPAPADAASNPPFDGRVFAIVLDSLETEPENTKRVREAAAQFVMNDVRPGDLVAVATSGGAVSQALTYDSALALKAIAAFLGAGPGSRALASAQDDFYMAPPGGSGRGANAASSAPGNVELNKLARFENAFSMLATLQSLTSYLAAIPDRRKAVILFSSGINYELNVDFHDSADTGRARQLAEAMGHAISAANCSDVSFYAVDSQGLGGIDLSQFDIAAPSGPGWTAQLQQELVEAHDSLRVLSSQTNGFATVDTNDLAPAFARILQENSSYYLLGYNESATDGKVHSLDVKVLRPGVVVHARKEYAATKLDTRASAPAGGPTSPTLMDAMAERIPVSDVRMRVSAAPFRGTQSSADLSLTVELNASRFTFKDKSGHPSDAVEIAVLSENQSGKSTVDEHRVIAIDPGANVDQVRARGVRLAERFAIKPGQYRLMVAVREINGGLTGTVPFDVTVPNFNRDYPSISGILLTSASAAGMATTGADTSLKQFLPAPPSAEREFARTDMLSLFTEVYDKPGSSLHVAASVAAEDGSQSHEIVAGAPAARPGGPPGTYVYAARVPLQACAPGQYILRIAASDADGGKPHEREVPFTVR